jgi:hypothetical protein
MGFEGSWRRRIFAALPSRSHSRGSTGVSLAQSCGLLHAVPDTLLVARLPEADSLQAGVVRGAERLMRSTCREVEGSSPCRPATLSSTGVPPTRYWRAQSTFDPDLLSLARRAETYRTVSLARQYHTKLLPVCAPFLIVTAGESHYRRLLIRVRNSAVSGNMLLTARSILNGGQCRSFAFDAPFAERIRR